MSKNIPFIICSDLIKLNFAKKHRAESVFLVESKSETQWLFPGETTAGRIYDNYVDLQAASWRTVKFSKCLSLLSPLS